MNNISLFEIARLLLTRDDYVILIHGHPDGDALGSAEALRLILSKAGKRACICCPDRIPSFLSFLLKEEVYDILPEKKTYISVDVAQTKLLGKFESRLSGKILLKIDHHRTGDDFAEYNYTNENASAAGEILYELSELMNLMSKEIAEALYAAIASDTGCFRFSNTTAATLSAAAELYKQGIDAKELNTRLFESKDPNTVKATAEGIKETEFLFDGRAAVVCFTAEMAKKGGYTDENLSELSSALREIDGVELTAVLKQSIEDERKFRLSTRSKRFFDCSALCVNFDGGGHLRAAGGSIYADSPAKALEILKEQIGKLWNT